VYTAPTEQPENLSTPSSNIPFRRDVDFVDRGNLLDQIAEKCNEGQSRVALVGIGGVG
jgi:hypothetical protein